MGLVVAAVVVMNSISILTHRHSRPLGTSSVRAHLVSLLT